MIVDARRELCIQFDVLTVYFHESDNIIPWVKKVGGKTRSWHFNAFYILKINKTLHYVSIYLVQVFPNPPCHSPNGAKCGHSIFATESVAKMYTDGTLILEPSHQVAHLLHASGFQRTDIHASNVVIWGMLTARELSLHWGPPHSRHYKKWSDSLWPVDYALQWGQVGHINIFFSDKRRLFISGFIRAF